MYEDFQQIFVQAWENVPVLFFGDCGSGFHLGSDCVFDCGFGFDLSAFPEHVSKLRIRLSPPAVPP